jgi:hypothetical protein
MELQINDVNGVFYKRAAPMALSPLITPPIPSELSFRYSRSSGMRLLALALVVILSVSILACKDDPVSSPKPPVIVNKTDTIRHSLSITPDSSATILIHSNLIFKLLATPTLPKPYTISWMIDSQTQSRTSVDTLKFKFDAGSQYSIKAVYIDSTGSRRDSIQSIVRVKDTTVLPGDSSSHDFEWTEFTNVGGENDMTGCWVFGSNDIWAVNGDIHHFDGALWSTPYKHTGGGLSGYSIFGFSDNDLWLIGNSQPAHYLGNGIIKSYSTYSLNHGRVYSAWGLSSNDLYVVGDSGLVAHFDGSKWNKMTTPTQKRLTSISGTSNGNIWASGFNTETGESELLHFDGSAWTKDGMSSSGVIDLWGIGSVWSCDSAHHDFTAVSGTSVLRQTDGGGWRNDSIVALSDHIGMYLTGNSANDIFAVGSYGLVLHWSGHTWKRYDQFLAESVPGYFPHQISIKGNSVCVVGTKNGTSWVLIGQRK